MDRGVELDLTIDQLDLVEAGFEIAAADKVLDRACCRDALGSRQHVTRSLADRISPIARLAPAAAV